MKNYRKKQSIYILISCYLQDEIMIICGKTTFLFESKNPHDLLVLRAQIDNLIKFVNKIPIYGKSDLKERKIKGSIHFEQKTFIIDELQIIRKNIFEALISGKNRILKSADVLDKIYNLKQYIYCQQVYFYDNEAEKKMSYQYSRYYEELKKKERRKEF